MRKTYKVNYCNNSVHNDCKSVDSNIYLNLMSSVPWVVSISSLTHVALGSSVCMLALGLSICTLALGLSVCTLTLNCHCCESISHGIEDIGLVLTSLG